LGSREPAAPNAWLSELTEYRNLVVHKTPLAAVPEAGALVVVERSVEEAAIRTIEVPIPDIASPGSSCDALTKVVALHEKLLGLARLAVERAPILVNRRCSWLNRLFSEGLVATLSPPLGRQIASTLTDASGELCRYQLTRRNVLDGTA